MTITEALDTAAFALGDLWLDNRITVSQATESARGLLAEWPPGEDAVRLAALSRAFESLRAAALSLVSNADILAVTETHLSAVMAVGWERATRLAQVAWAWARVFIPNGPAQALALLQSSLPREDGKPSEPEGPPLERAWWDLVLSALYCVSGDHDLALAKGLRAEALANEADHDPLRSAAAQILGFVYLSVGDVEGACTVVPLGIAAQRRSGHLGIGLSANYLLCLVLCRNFEEASRLLRDWPELQQARAHATLPALKALVARVRLSEGLLDAAADLPSLGWSPTGAEPHTMAANRLWVGADVLTGLGRPDEARQHLRDGLDAFASAGVALLPMNATQLHRALADAHEVAGDPPAAMAALRQSQAHCFTWVGTSMRARLQALHFSAPQGTSAHLRGRQDQRMKLVEGALARAYDDTAALEATLVNQHKLLAQVTHEVRNPLHGVVWMTSMLMMSDLDDRQREFLGLANSSARMALNLCNDVLDLAKMDAGKFTLRTEPLQLAELVGDCVKVFAAPAQARGVALHWQCDPTLPDVLLGDPLRLQQVLMNLLSNATKFTRQGRIDVELAWLGAAADSGQPTVRLSVSDTGLGLPEDLLPHLFQEFAQAQTPMPGVQAGAGLGLALCRQFVHLMGGRIGVENRPGEGCTFWCLLPLKAA